MSRQANILSFDEAKTASDARRRRGGASPYAGFKDNGLNRPRSSKRSAGSGDEGGPASRPARTGRADRPARAQAHVEEGARVYVAAANQPDDALEARASRRKQRAKARSRSRAEKLFAKQYGDDERSPDLARASSRSEDAAPRAALYATKMGASHRKSARMQRSSTAQPQAAKLDPFGWFNRLRIRPATLKAATAVLCVVLVGLFLYTPARQYYQAQREHDRLAAEYAVLEQRNDALDLQNGSLSSNAGMEDAVRQKYGYVVQGDETAVVTGLADSTTDASRGVDGVEANVLSSAVKAPEEWYTPYLDALFGVS